MSKAIMFKELGKEYTEDQLESLDFLLKELSDLGNIVFITAVTLKNYKLLLGLKEVSIEDENTVQEYFSKQNLLYAYSISPAPTDSMDKQFCADIIPALQLELFKAIDV